MPKKRYACTAFSPDGTSAPDPSAADSVPMTGSLATAHRCQLRIPGVGPATTCHAGALLRGGVHGNGL